MTGLMDLLQGPSHPDQVGKAFGLLNDKLAKDEQGQFDETFADNFVNYQSLKDQGKQQKGIDEWKETDHGTPLERWRKQIEGMVQSGNPVLMKKGMEMLTQQHNRETAPPVQRTDNRTSDIKNWQEAQRGGYKGSLIDFINMKKQPQFAPKRVTTPDAKNLEWEDQNRTDPIVGQKWDDIYGQVRTKDDSDRENKIASNVLRLGNNALFGEDGESGIYGDYDNSMSDRFKLMATGNIQQLIQSDPEYRNYDQFRQGVAVMLAKSFGESGALSNQDVARALSLLPNITGINPDSPAVARQKMYLLEQLIATHNDGKGNKGNVEKMLKDVTGDFKQKTFDSTPDNEADMVAGHIYSGELYLGGDPSQPKSWRE